ncbi:MAG: phosphate ABC transporter permease subunit PstC [Acidobacteriota bacterium]|nr:phosphate ABC transporter permease subunit PstC [Acidobacteriota bacterium]MDW3228356.1 phosphate ABC transporter permease subunit PstC [Acidobacteriota bacterium]MDY0232250.1 phosphate ABC transporter permease subunit PstC [Candidatus Saccharicenans sp.]
MRSVKKKGILADLREGLIHRLFQTSGLMVIAILLGIIALLLYTSVPAFREIGLREFLTSTRWDPTSPEKPEYGFLSMLASTIMVTIGAMVISFPLGVAVASYLSDVAAPKVREIVKPIVELLAAIPSVVVGFIGITLVGPLIARVFNLSHGLNALNGSLLLAIMALPTIISISEDSLNAVPVSYVEASLALGANPWETLIKVKIPAAASGIIASLMLGMGRAIGETMTVLMATGNARAFPSGFLQSVRTLTANIAIELGEVPYYSTHYYALFALGLVLFLITFFINLSADVILEKQKRKLQ